MHELVHGCLRLVVKLHVRQYSACVTKRSVTVEIHIYLRPLDTWRPVVGASYGPPQWPFLVNATVNAAALDRESSQAELEVPGTLNA